jgi:hypothetical protein
MLNAVGCFIFFIFFWVEQLGIGGRETHDNRERDRLEKSMYLRLWLNYT